MKREKAFCGIWQKAFLFYSQYQCILGAIVKFCKIITIKKAIFLHLYTLYIQESSKR